jgi:hypothetical protein
MFLAERLISDLGLLLVLVLGLGLGLVLDGWRREHISEMRRTKRGRKPQKKIESGLK